MNNYSGMCFLCLKVKKISILFDRNLDDDDLLQYIVKNQIEGKSLRNLNRTG